MNNNQKKKHSDPSSTATNTQSNNTDNNNSPASRGGQRSGRHGKGRGSQQQEAAQDEPLSNNESLGAVSNISRNSGTGGRAAGRGGGNGGRNNSHSNGRQNNQGGRGGHHKVGRGDASKRGRSGGEDEDSQSSRHGNNNRNRRHGNKNHHGKQQGRQGPIRAVVVSEPTANDVASDDGAGSVASSASPRFLSDQRLPPQTTGTNTTPYTRPRRPPAATPEGISPFQDPAVYVSPYVRLVAEREETNTTVRTLESLLKYGTANIGTEEDTPFLGPMINTSAVGGEGGALSVLELNGSVDIANLDDEELMFQGNESIVGKNVAAAVKPPSPGLKFSLDGVATPNTWGAFATAKGLLSSIPNMVSLPPSTDPADYGGYGHTEFSSGLSVNKSVATPESSMYRFLMNDYNRETDTFKYRSATAPEVKAKFMARISDLCLKVSSILENECLMCAVPTPVYVLGDIHGNFCDVSYFLKSVLAFNDIHLSPHNILCLGDYVDRGAYSLECVLLLFALKATAPHKVTLLRGNHEDRVVCGDRRTYGNDCFFAQCQNIFGIGGGLGVFLAVTEVFRHLPLAAEIVISNAPNNPQAPRDLADEDDWESVPNTSSLEPYGKFPPPSSANTTPGQTLVQTAAGLTPQTPPSGCIPPKTPKNAFGIEHSNPRDVRKMFTDRNWLRRQTHVERILCTHGGIPRFNCPPKEADSLAFLRSSSFPRLLTLFPNNPFMRDHQPAEVERFRNVPEEVMQRAWFTMFDLMWSDPTVDDTNVNEWGFGINTRGNTVVSFSTKAVETFLDAYKYSMLFRAHQEKAHGIRLSKSKKVLTIFSTSNYLGHGNGAGCAVVSPYGEIQLIVKTSE